MDKNTIADVSAPTDEHDIGSLLEQSEAWLAVVDVLHEVTPGWMNGEGTGIEMSVTAIRGLAARAAAPVSGQGASIDTPEFGELVSEYIHCVTMQEGDSIGTWNALIAHIRAWADSRPRSEDSRAKVLEEEVAELTHVLGFETRVKCRLRDENISLRAALASSAAPSTSHAEAGGLWEWAPGLKLEEDEVIHYSEIYQTAEGLPVMTDSSQHSTWNVASVFKRAADGVDSRHPVRILTVEPSSAARPPASRPRSEDSRAKVLAEAVDALDEACSNLQTDDKSHDFWMGVGAAVETGEKAIRALASSAAPEPDKRTLDQQWLLDDLRKAAPEGSGETA